MVELFMQYLPAIAKAAGILLMIVIAVVSLGCLWLRVMRNSEDNAV